MTASGTILLLFKYPNVLTFLRSTRPFLSTIEKKWIAFQLLTGMRDARSRKARYSVLVTVQLCLTYKYRLLTEI